MVHGRRPLSVQILGYLCRNPDAHDTVEGITQWWLVEQQIVEQMDAVQIALDELVAAQLIRVHSRPGLGTSYSIDPARVEEIAVLLREEK